MSLEHKLPPSLDDEDFRSIEYWKPHFDGKCQISLQYYTVTDKTKILGVYAENPNQGDKRPVIMVPGWFSLISGWTEVLKTISKDTSVLYIETREKGSSILPNHDVSMDIPRMTDDIVQASNHFPLNFEKSVVVCSSMGGSVILELLSRNTRQPEKAIMIGPNPEFSYPWILNIVLRFPLWIHSPIKRAVKWYIRNFRIDMDKEPQQYKKYAGVLDNAEPWKLRESGKQCLSYKAWDKLEKAEISTEVYIIGASADKMHDAEQTQRVHAVITRSEFVDFFSNKSTHSSEMGEYILEKV